MLDHSDFAQPLLLSNKIFCCHLTEQDLAHKSAVITHLPQQLKPFSGRPMQLELGKAA